MRGARTARWCLVQLLLAAATLAMVGGTLRCYGAEPFTMNPGMAARLRTVKAEIVSGRFQLVAARGRGSSTSMTRNGSSTERLSVDTRGPRPVIQYVQKSTSRTLRIATTGDGQLEISDQELGLTGDPKKVLEFRQPPHEPLTFTLVDSTGSVTIHADGLWHLQLSHPALCREHLNPLLHVFRADWNLAETADAVEKLLMDCPAQPTDGRREKWQAWVDQLASEEFSVRQAADRRLRGEGAAVMPFLRGLDRRQLDAEQWFRVRRMIAALSGGREEDSARSIAQRLANDPRVWHSLLVRDEARFGPHAVAHLARLLNEPIAWDNEADAADRQRLVESIGRRIAPPKHD